jgi:hypothetical protein
MPIETMYKSVPFILAAKSGVIARPIIDRAPEGSWLSLFNIESREEESLSSRYGSILINRDPNGTPSGQNHFLPGQINTITRLKGLNGNVWRYAQSGSGLYRRAGNSQGAYSLIYSGLSGNAFSSIISPTLASGVPYLFVADSSVMIKDIGTGSPTRWGILPPTQVAYAIPYSPTVTEIDTFLSTSGYSTSGFSISGVTSIGTANGSSGLSILSGNYYTYACTDGSIKNLLTGMLAKGSGGVLRQVFNVLSDASAFSINPLGGAPPVLPTDSFSATSLNGTVAAASTGSIGKTVSFNFGANLPNDLFVLVLSLSNPSAVQEIRLQFDVNNSGYSSSYYYKSLVLPSFQDGISLPQTTSPSQAVNTEVFSRAGGATNLQQVNAPYSQIIPEDDPSIGQLQPNSLTSGEGSWTVSFNQLGDFLAVGNAGEPGLDWSNITGWQILVITNSQGSTDISLNGLYLQGGSGPSCYGGLGYDYRYTYFNVATGTESSPCGESYFETTQSNPGATSTLILMRQSSSVTGRYSSDPQVTHVRMYRRGGTLSQNWLYLDQFPNVTGSSLWTYKDIIPDSSIIQDNILELDNDPPVTSSLPTPFITTLSAPLSPSPPFSPITVGVAGGTFVSGQEVVIGTPENLEQVYVVTGGTGSFTACIQLSHDLGEQVQVFSLPAVPCNLAVLAYGQVWLAGDPNNPHLLYYSNPDPNGQSAGLPENFSPANYIPVSSPSDPIMALINFRGSLLVATLTTWYLVSPGSPPIAQPTGSKHGLIANFGWCQTENAIWYLSSDGIRTFTGSDGPYQSLPIEWVWQQGNNAQVQALSPIVFASPSILGQTQMAFRNNKVYITYYGVDGNWHQLRHHTLYHRYEDANSSFLLGPALYYEADINLLLASEYVNFAGVTPGWAVAEWNTNQSDSDDAGWATSGSGLLTSPISIAPQTPYFDQGAPNNQKQYNVLTIDANTNNQVLTVYLLFDDGTTSLNLGTIQSTIRTKFQLQVNGGLGQQAYRVSLKITGAISAAPILYQADLHYALLAEQRSSFDSYWVKFGTEESKIAKNLYIDYTSSAPVTVNVYVDGASSPYWTFTLPTNPNRLESVVRSRLPALPFRLWRCVMTVPVGQTLQIWSAPTLDQKMIAGGNSKGYQRSELVTQ